MPTAEMKSFIVTTSRTAELVEGGLQELQTRGIEAAYYASEGGFTTFKDTDHRQVFTARDDILLSVEYLPGAQPPLSAVLELLGQSREKGEASGRILLGGTSDYPGGPLRQPAYDITVTHVAAADENGPAGELIPGPTNWAAAGTTIGR